MFKYVISAFSTIALVAQGRQSGCDLAAGHRFNSGREQVLEVYYFFQGHHLAESSASR